MLALHEVPADRHAQELGIFPKIEHPEAGTYSTVNIPMRFATADVAPRGPAPRVGEHTRSVLNGVGLNDKDIDVLIESGTIGAEDGVE